MKKLFRLILSVLFLLPVFLAGGQRIYRLDRNRKLPENLVFGLPCPVDLILHKTGFVLGYSYERRQALWVSYMLRGKHLTGKKVKRIDKFQIDPEVLIDPVHPDEYAKSGYDRGHLAPAADLRYSLPSMKDSFFMSNMSPQLPACNRGCWRRVESQVRKWAIKEKRVYVISGPIFGERPKMLGRTNIPIPDYFFKIVFDTTPPVKMIAFIVPNRGDRRRVGSFTVTTDHVETLTGYDFFTEMYDPLEERMEKQCDFKAWK